MMVRKRSKRALYIVIGVLIALVFVVGIVVFAKTSNNETSKNADTSPSTDTTKTPDATTPSNSENDNNTSNETPDVPKDTTNTATIDPGQVSTIAIEPMLITVSYMKGIEGFDFQVLRNPNGTKYVQFSAPKLVGTKCTNDVGAFVSIIENPTADEAATLTKTTETDGKTYGLSLADATCTADAALLKQYQDAFSEPFSLLKKI